MFYVWKLVVKKKRIKTDNDELKKESYADFSFQDEERGTELSRERGKVRQKERKKMLDRRIEIGKDKDPPLYIRFLCVMHLCTPPPPPPQELWVAIKIIPCKRSFTEAFAAEAS